MEKSEKIRKQIWWNRVLLASFGLSFGICLLVTPQLYRVSSQRLNAEKHEGLGMSTNFEAEVLRFTSHQEGARASHHFETELLGHITNLTSGSEHEKVAAIEHLIINIGDYIMDRCERYPYSGKRHMMHNFVFFGREESPELNRLYLENFLLMLSMSSPNVEYYITAMGRDSKKLILRILPNWRNLCNIGNISFVPRRAEGDLCEHQRQLRAIQKSGREYDMYMFTNDGVRPLILDTKAIVKGSWTSSFKRLLQDAPYAAPFMSCEIQPHLQTHFFVMTQKGTKYLDELYCSDSKTKNIRLKTTYGEQHTFESRPMYLREFMLSSDVLADGYGISSFLYGTKYINTTALKNASRHYSEIQKVVKEQIKCDGVSNPSLCFVGNPRDVMFLKWGGTPHRVGVNLECEWPRVSEDWHCKPSVKLEDPAGQWCDAHFRISRT